MKSSCRTVLNATYVAAIFLSLLTPAFAQQEIDPTWYDPWAKPAAHVVHAPTPVSQKQHAVRQSSAERAKEKKEVRAREPRGTERAALTQK